MASGCVKHTFASWKAAMHTFKDGKGDIWSLDMTVGALKRVLAIAKVDLRRAAEPYAATDADTGVVSLSAYIDLDTIVLVDVLYAMCFPEAESRNLTEDEFMERFTPETIREAHDVFFEEWSDFFRRSGSSQVAAILDKQVKFVKAAVARAEQEWDRTGAAQKLDAILDKQVEDIGKAAQEAVESLAQPATYGTSPTNLPESVESTPTISPSDDS